MAEKDAALQEIEGLSDLPPSIDVDLGGGEPDTVEGKGAGKKTSAAAPPPKEDENVVALRRQLREQEQARKSAEAQRDEQKRAREAAEAQTAEGQLRLINNSLEGAEAAKARAKSDLKAALAAGDHDAAVDAQEALNEAQIKRDQLMRGKSSMEERAERERAERERKPVDRTYDDPVEAMIATVSPKSGAWLRNNPECVTDNRKNRQMIRAHEDALDEGVGVDTPEYFAFIEKRLGIGHSDDGPGERQQQRQEPAPRRSAPADAPPSRATSNDGRGSRQNTVTLSPAQRQFCDESGIKYEDYARSMVELKKEGRLQ